MPSNGCEPSVSTLRHRIIIQNVTRVRDAMGGWTESWGTFATVWADVHAMSAREVNFSESLGHRVTHRVTMRYLADIASDMRISFDNRILDIQGFRNPDGRKRFLEVMCEERTEVDNQPEQNITTEDGENLQTEAGEDIVTEG